MTDKKDIRIKILLHLEQVNFGTAEFVANEFLASLHSDLGTIRRALLDLITDGYIRESNVDSGAEQSRIKNINTRGSTELKNSKRLLNPQDIPQIRLYITLSGRQFLIELENLKYTTWSIRNENWMKLIYIIFGALLSSGLYYLNSTLLNNKSENPKEQESGSSANKNASNYQNYIEHHSTVSDTTTTGDTIKTK